MDGRVRPVVIESPKFERAIFEIVGTAPLVMNAFPAKARQQMRERQAAGSKAGKGKAREPKDFERAYNEAVHRSREGWCGIPAGAFRNAMISACRVVGFQMTRAKLSVFVEADGYDAADGTPLVRITKGEPHYVEHMVRNDSGVADIRPRAMWDEGWESAVSIRWDAGQFSLTDVANLMLRVGLQVGLLEGRPDSKNSGGMGWGLFKLKEPATA